MRADGVHGACVSRQVQSMSVIPVCRSAVAAQKKTMPPSSFHRQSCQVRMSFNNYAFALHFLKRFPVSVFVDIGESL